MFELCCTFTELVSYLFFVIVSCIPFTTHKHRVYLIFSAFTYRLVSLLVSNKASVFFFEVCMFPTNKLVSSA